MTQGPPAPNANDEAPDELERCAARLEASADFRVLRRLKPLPAKTMAAADRRGIFVDVETTGLDPEADEIIEIAMLSFVYALDGGSSSAGESFEALRDPGRPIPPEVVRLTGIDDAAVAGRSIDLAQVAALLHAADLVIAHNADFDRRFCERLCSAFADKPWACSYREIAWKDEGFDSARLGHLALGHGLFFDAHRALDDCVAGLEILSRPLPRSGLTGLNALLHSARRPTWRLRAVDAPFEVKSTLKHRGYRWNDGSDGSSRSWYIDVNEEALAAETEYLRREIYQRCDPPIECTLFTAFDRYSRRHR